MQNIFNWLCIFYKLPKKKLLFFFNPTMMTENFFHFKQQGNILNSNSNINLFYTPKLKENNEITT